MLLQNSNVVDGQLQLNMNQVIIFAWNYLLWAFALGWVYQLTSRYSLEAATWKKEALPLLLVMLMIAGVQLVISNLLYYFTLTLIRDFAWGEMIQGLSGVLLKAYASRLIDLLVIIGILRALSNSRKLNEQKLAVSELQSILTETRLEALRMQLNPHFLFNSLHAIHSMIGYDNEKARAMLLKISSLLRKILEMGEKQRVPLSEELGYLRDYLDIEQERFHDRLEINYNIPDELLTVLVPSLLLQPLAENALKHGISQLEGAGEINIKVATETENELLISIDNTINETQTSEAASLGIGLKNLTKRLIQLYDDQYSLSALPAGNRFIVTIKIPIQYED